MTFNKEKAIASAKKFLEKGQIDKAILEYQKIVEAEPDDLKSVQKLAELYVKQGSRQEAINVFLRLGEEFLRQGFSSRAISIYKQILQLNPLFIPAYIRLSEIFKSLGLSKDARIFNQRAIEIAQKATSTEDLYKLINKIVSIDPDDVVSRIALAETCLKMNKTEEAISHFEAALPILREQHLDDLFIRAAERILFHKPNNVQLIRELAVLHMMRKEIPKAMKLLLHCRKIDPEDIETLDLLIQHFLSSRNFEKAVLVLFEKYKILKNRGMEEESKQILWKILEIDPANEEAKKLLSQKESYGPEEVYPLKEAKFSKPHLEPVMTVPVESALEEEIEEKYINEADIFIKYNLKEKALEHLFRGLEETRGSLKVRKKLKDLYIDMGDLNLGIEQLFILAQQVMNTNPEEAKLFLKEILLLNPNDTRATKMLNALGERYQPQYEIQETQAKVIPLDRFVQPTQEIEQQTTLLQEETSDITYNHSENIGEIESLEEPFSELGFSPPETRTTYDLTTEEIQSLETETTEDKPSIKIDHGPRIPEVEQVLDEADFFVSQGLYQDAIVLLEDTLKYHPSNLLIQEKISEIRAKLEANKLPMEYFSGISPAIDEMETRSISQVTNEAFEELGALENIISETAEKELPSTPISSPSEIDIADAQTHYDLGIAYKEMGLWNQAINEFKISSHNSTMEAMSHSLIGDCFKEQGNLDEAIKEYKLGLYAKEKTLDQEMSLYNSLAEAYILQGDFKEALYYLQSIKKKKPDYENIDNKINEVKEKFHTAIKSEEPDKSKKKPSSSPVEAAKEIDEAFDDLFGDFSSKKK